MIHAFHWTFRNWILLTVEGVKKIIKGTKSKSYELDPVPTVLVKLCINELSPIITSIVNASLNSKTMPDTLDKSKCVR